MLYFLSEVTGKHTFYELLYIRYSGYQRFFSRAVGIFGVGRRPTHLRPYKDLTETGNRARKVSGTQGIYQIHRD